MSQSERLGRFFRALRPLLQRASYPPSSRPAANVGVANFEHVLKVLSGPIRDAKQAGETTNFWAIAGLKRNEVRNASALAALWTPSLFPQTAAPFLASFLQEISGWNTPSLQEELTAGYVVRTEEWPIGDLKSRVDISIETTRSLLIVEVKIDASESGDQLLRYAELLNWKAKMVEKRPGLILLGSRPSPSNVAFHARWEDIASAARKVISKRKFADQTFADQLLRHFAVHVHAFD